MWKRGDGLDEELRSQFPNMACTFDVMNAVRNGTVVIDVIGAGCALSTGVDSFYQNPHILYADSCFTSDGWVIMLACFLDCNHHVHPVGFRLCVSESYCNWFLFLSMLKRAGITLETIPDLVINSDRNPGLLSAIKHIFPHCEHVPCCVHIERNMQQAWNKHHPPLVEENGAALRTFNRMVECYRCACLAMKKEECEEWMAKMKLLEMKYSQAEDPDDPCPVYDYVADIKGVFMWKWHYNHLMQRTSNPIESCMSLLCRDFLNRGTIRESPFFSRYRSLVIWMIINMKKREKELTSVKLIMPVVAKGQDNIYCPWALKEIVKRGHYVEYYRHKLIVEPCNGNGDLVTEEWNGKPVEQPASILGKYKYRVTDTGHRKVYYVYLSDTDNPCSCHQTHWEKMPCIHVIRVLHYRREYNEVWGYVGECYKLDAVRKTCATLDEKQMALLDRLCGEESVKSKRMSKVVRAHSHGNGRKRNRIPSSGEWLVSEKKRVKETSLYCCLL